MPLSPPLPETMTPPPIPLRPPPKPPDDEADDRLVDRGLPIGLRVLALVGALSFVMLGLNSLLPVFQTPPAPPSMPDQREGNVS